MKFQTLFSIIAASFFFASCTSIDYSSKEKWLIRDNARPQYSAAFDIFYVGSDYYALDLDLDELKNFVVRELVRRCEKKARVFVPMVQTPEDMEAALELYLELYHGENERPFALLCQGEAGKLLMKIALKRSKTLKEMGLFFLRYSEFKDESFLSEELCGEIMQAFEWHHGKVLWGREIHEIPAEK